MTVWDWQFAKQPTQLTPPATHSVAEATANKHKSNELDLSSSKTYSTVPLWNADGISELQQSVNQLETQALTEPFQVAPAGDPWHPQFSELEQEVQKLENDDQFRPLFGQ